MTYWDQPLGAAPLVAGILGNVTHIRHPDNQQPMCGQLTLVLIAVGQVAVEDPAVHPACLTAWRAARMSAKTGGF